jgi:dihydroorotate dehydrogenase
MGTNPVPLGNNICADRPMYNLLKKALFKLAPETSHEISLDALGAAHRLGILKHCFASLAKPVNLMGLTFPNPVGLAAGLDKNGDYFNALGDLGFGFVEIGTVTPKPQPGNPEPRLFRLVEQNAIINRMGFNNKGVEHLVAQVKNRKYQGILGINIGKNKATPDEDALQDYIIGLRAVYAHADYVAINISSPNTPGLRDLQFGDSLKSLISGIKKTQLSLFAEQDKQVPIAVKIAPDMTDEQIEAVALTLKNEGMDAVIATNTTLSRNGVEASPFAGEAGGLSGAPLTDKSTHVIRVLSNTLQGSLPIIGVGGIFSAEDAQAKITAGAALVQIYSGFIYRGPALIKECVNAIQR